MNNFFDGNNAETTFETTTIYEEERKEEKMNIDPAKIIDAEFSVIEEALVTGENTPVTLNDTPLDLALNKGDILGSVIRKRTRPIEFEPTLEYVLGNIPAKPAYISGRRENVSAFGTHDVSKLKTMGEIIDDIGANFEAVKAPTYYKDPDTGLFIPVKGSYGIINATTRKPIGHCSESYGIIQFPKIAYVFNEFIEKLKNTFGLECTPTFAQVWNNGAKLFIQYHIGGFDALGEKIDSYATLITSHDSTSAVMITLGKVRAFCKNTMPRLIKNADSKLVLKHTNGNASLVEKEVAKLYDGEMREREAYIEDIKMLQNIRMTPDHLYAAIKRYYDYNSILKADSQRKMDNFLYQTRNVFACLNMPDVENVKNTALGAKYAFSDFVQHVKPLRSKENSSYIEEVANGSPEIDKFMDIVLKACAENPVARPVQVPLVIEG